MATLLAGVPELRPDSRYNTDTRIITSKFSIGVDILSVIVETTPNGCVDYDVVALMDQFEGRIREVPGVQSVISLPAMTKIVNAGLSEGALKWRILPLNRQALAQAVSHIDTGTGLLNADSSVMPILIFLTDHKAGTLRAVTAKLVHLAALTGREFFDAVVSVDAIEAVEELSRADGSSAWVVLACNVATAAAAAYLEPDVSERIFSGRRPIIAGQGAPNGRAVAALRSSPSVRTRAGSPSCSSASKRFHRPRLSSVGAGPGCHCTSTASVSSSSRPASCLARDASRRSCGRRVPRISSTRARLSIASFIFFMMWNRSKTWITCGRYSATTFK